MKKFYNFAIVIVAVFATIGGVAYLLHDGHVIFAVAVLLLAAMASPLVVAAVRDILGDGADE